MNTEALPGNLCDNQTQLVFRAQEGKIMSVDHITLDGVDYCKIIAKEAQTHFTIDLEVSITYSRSIDDRLVNLRIYFADPEDCILDTNLKCSGYLVGYSPDKYAAEIFSTFKFTQ